jgi:hypothetical protein
MQKMNTLSPQECISPTRGDGAWGAAQARGGACQGAPRHPHRGACRAVSSCCCVSRSGNTEGDEVEGGTNKDEDGALLRGEPLRGGGRWVVHAGLERPVALLCFGAVGRSAIVAFSKCIILLDFVTVEQAMHLLCM